MARTTATSSIKHTDKSLPGAQLWIGPPEVLAAEAQTFLQTIFCKQNGCKTCTICTQVTQQQHHAIIWLAPEKYYTIETLDPLFATIPFSLQPGELMFFVMQKADALTPACANKLLKPIEEPPPGYHFLLLAERSELIVPTIRSRCIIKTWHQASTSSTHAKLFDSFTKKKAVSPSSFLTILEQTNINERESIELLDAVLHYWVTTYKKSPESDSTKTLNMIAILKQASKQLPMPGSSKIFWRNLFLQMYD